MRYLAIKDVCRMLEVSRSTLHRLRRQPNFPAPLTLPHVRAPRWTEEQISQYAHAKNPQNLSPDRLVA